MDSPHAEDPAAGPDESSPSDNQILAEAASVAEAVVGAFSQTEIGELSASSESESEDEDDASICSDLVIDERDNELDELDSQSQSILANCRLDGAPSAGELLNDSQIVIINQESNCNSMSNDNNTFSEPNDSNENNGNENSNGNNNDRNDSNIN